MDADRIRRQGGRVSAPRERIEAECRRTGVQAFAARCSALLDGDATDGNLIDLLAGDAMPALRADPDRDDAYWLRVWAARGLMWGWHEDATPALVRALDDEAWRVREMAAKVVARNRVDLALEAVSRLRHDDVERVRHAAERAVRGLTGQASQGVG